METVKNSLKKSIETRKTKKVVRRRDEEILFDRIAKAACQDQASGSNDVKETINHKSTNGINREKNVGSSGGKKNRELININSGQRLIMKRHGWSRRR